MRPEWVKRPYAVKLPETCQAPELDKEIALAKEVEAIEAAVDNFAARMKARLTQKAKQGFSGWETAHPDVMRSLILGSVTKTSTLDLGIYAMMLAHRGISMKQGDSNEG